MNEKSKIEALIFNDEINEAINRINNHLKSTNIFEIAGMGSQEIKHSRILGWLMSTGHDIKDHFFINFLKHAITFTQEQDYGFDDEKLQILKEYIYLSPANKSIDVRFEYKNIDILLIDEKNKFVFVVENKVFAQESSEQLAKYKNIVAADFPDYHCVGIFLTIDGSLPDEASTDGNDNLQFYLVAWYEKIYIILQSILENENFSFSIESRLIVEHYVDLLLRRDIVTNNEIKMICEKIWINPDYKEALEILFANRPSKNDFIRNFLKNKSTIVCEKTTGDVLNLFFKVDESGFIFRIVYSKNKGLSFSICTDETSDLSMTKPMQLPNKSINRIKTPYSQYKFKIVSVWYGYQHLEEEINDELMEAIIHACSDWISSLSK
ncbi:PD-(D/E)XK nuclease family protein [Sulfuricurvum sp.]|uniref:PDDEXK-like family protein n=1 Tax=Sulfuricurvum sp. TaxID=2025608 RepID=UPI003BB57247